MGASAEALAHTSTKPGGPSNRSLSNGSYNSVDPDRLAAVLLAEGVPLVRVPADLERALLVSGAVVSGGCSKFHRSNLHTQARTFQRCCRVVYERWSPTESDIIRWSSCEHLSFINRHNDMTSNLSLMSFMVAIEFDLTSNLTTAWRLAIF